jgi:hypothetical protein
MDSVLNLVYYGEGETPIPNSIFHSREEILEIWQSDRAYGEELVLG